MAICINTDDVILDNKGFYLNNGDLVIVRVNKEDTHYLVSSYVDPDESQTAPYCVLIQFVSGNKIATNPQIRKTTHQELSRVINNSYYHKKDTITSDNIKIVGRDYYEIDIRPLEEV
jgi:hypothetical protein